MSDYYLHFYETKEINDDGTILLPLQHIKSNLFVKSPFTKIEKDTIVAIEKVDLPIENEFIPAKRFFDYKEAFTYSNSIKQLIYYDDTQKNIFKRWKNSR